jgi:hypothetical protein
MSPRILPSREEHPLARIVHDGHAVDVFAVGAFSRDNIFCEDAEHFVVLNGDVRRGHPVRSRKARRRALKVDTRAHRQNAKDV